MSSTKRLIRAALYNTIFLDLESDPQGTLDSDPDPERHKNLTECSNNFLSKSYHNLLKCTATFQLTPYLLMVKNPGKCPKEFAWPAISARFFPGRRLISTKFHQNPFIIFGDIFTRNDYTRTDRRTRTQTTALHNH